MKLLVTGGAGFIGSNFIRYVIDNPEIEKLVNMDCLTYAGDLRNLDGIDNNPKYKFSNVNIIVQEDIRSLIWNEGITHVIHFAAESHVDKSISNPSSFVYTNVVGTYNLLECCKSLNVQRFHHVSTDEVYGSLGFEGYFTETSPYAPNSPYSATKASSDMMVRAYHHTYGLNTVITNCSNNYGPYQFPEKLIPVAIQNLIHENPVPVYGNGMNIRDWLFVDDHAEALWQVLTRGRAGETYNIGGNTERTNIQIVEKICNILDADPDLIQFVEDRKGHDYRYAIDASKIKRDLGWEPQYDFNRALYKTVYWYVENQPWVDAVLSKN